jgi:hypothetical protein
MSAEYDRYWTNTSSLDRSWIGLEHDSIRETAQDFSPMIIDRIREKGYTLVTVGDCLGFPNPADWYRTEIMSSPLF